MATGEDLKNISMPRKVTLGAGVVLLIASFLPWYHISIGGFGGVSANGWHGLGVIAWLLVIALLVLEGCRIAGVLPLEEDQAELASLAAAAGAVVFGLIYVLVRLIDGHLGFGLFIGVVALAALAFGAFGLYRSGSAMAALKGLQKSPGKDSPEHDAN